LEQASYGPAQWWFNRMPRPDRIIMENWRPCFKLSEEARPGDFIYVPPYVPHQEINASSNEICEAVVVRDGQNPIVVNLDVHTPEPASAGHSGMPFHPEG
jgi:hypothetical protein